MKKTLLSLLIFSLLFSAFGCASSNDKNSESRYFAPVQDAKSSLWGYIDKTGAFVIQPQFIKAWNFVRVN